MATYTEVGICNLALSRIGHLKPIASLSEATQAAVACSLHYAPSRDFVLRDFPWPFARGFALLTLVETFDESDPEHTQWAHSYRLPTGVLAIRRFLSATGKSDTDPPPFEIGSDSTGRLVYANVEPDEAYVETTRAITDTALFDDSFAAALSWHLALQVAPSVASAEKAREALNGYMLATGAAQRTASVESRVERLHAGDFLRSRGGD